MVIVKFTCVCIHSSFLFIHCLTPLQFAYSFTSWWAFGLLSTKLLHTFVCVHGGYSILSWSNSGSVVRDHMVGVCLTFLINCLSVFQSGCLYYFWFVQYKWENEIQWGNVRVKFWQIVGALDFNDSCCKFDASIS
jgi:hypothetical protein